MSVSAPAVAHRQIVWHVMGWTAAISVSTAVTHPPTHPPARPSHLPPPHTASICSLLLAHARTRMRPQRDSLPTASTSMQPEPAVTWQPESRKGSSSFLQISSASPAGRQGRHSDGWMGGWMDEWVMGWDQQSVSGH